MQSPYSLWESDSDYVFLPSTQTPPVISVKWNFMLFLFILIIGINTLVQLECFEL